MKKTWITYGLIACVSLALVTGCVKKEDKEEVTTTTRTTISANDVDNIVVSKDNKRMETLIKGIDDDKIDEFVEIYNSADFTEDASIDEDQQIELTINLSNADTVELSGGDENYESCYYNGKTFKVSSEELANYFDSLNYRYLK
ncbi:hypothetical protein [Clostridium cellulovorans]|uniref:Lipoprotein n=1 Tax=Clostridium cellulovorans (strain ATCC 35296 / DSM 3052 / OCM 3 / 743B) TaxID=573061 RepID=D9SRQ2_CLOC7|nr:hypothetical protein [Clostridium cellulovorans]ADL50419.1 hypothetical protein Clocel_0648 [Clostridium cellulovorans 743B]